MENLKTLVFFDLETTGLPINGVYPKITQLSMGSCLEEDLPVKGGPPKVLDKITMFFNPDRPIDKIASKITGLTNEMLINYPKFSKDAVDVIKSFLKSKPNPILIAHSGDLFDYPVLATEIFNIGEEGLDVECVDSLYTFKKIYWNSGQFQNFKLTTIYTTIFGEGPKNLHDAEGDVMTLLRCCQATAQFIEKSEKKLFKKYMPK
jgi:hypothetical protein